MTGVLVCYMGGGGFVVDQSGTRTDFAPSTVELHFSGLIGTKSHPDMQKIRIIGFFFFFKISYIGILKLAGGIQWLF